MNDYNQHIITFRVRNNNKWLTVFTELIYHEDKIMITPCFTSDVNPIPLTSVSGFESKYVGMISRVKLMTIIGDGLSEHRAGWTLMHNALKKKLPVWNDSVPSFLNQDVWGVTILLGDFLEDGVTFAKLSEINDREYIVPFIGVDLLPLPAIMLTSFEWVPMNISRPSQYAEVVNHCKANRAHHSACWKALSDAWLETNIH